MLSRGPRPSIEHTNDQTEFGDPAGWAGGELVVFAITLWFVGHYGARMCSSEVFEDRLKFRHPRRRVSA